MVRIGSIIGMCLVAVQVLAQKDITTVFQQKWKVNVGVSTYRTNMVSHEGKIYIGSNGEDRNYKRDLLDGVYEIDAKTGKILHHFEIPFMGDNDVNGVAVGNGKLFFGTDNYYFFCFDLKSKKELWKYNLPYDVESCPQLADLNGDKVLDVAFNVEQNEFYALNGVDGSLLWKNNMLTSHNGNVSPLAFDVNDDGVMDFITSGRGNANSDEIDGFKMRHYGDYNCAINGRDGSIIWSVETGAGVHASPFLYRNGKQIEFLFLDCYGQMSAISKEGKLLKTVNFGYDNFSSPLVTADKHLIIGRGSLQFDEKFFKRDHDTLPAYILEDAKYFSPEIEGKISASSMTADVLGLKKDQVIGVTESGILFILSTDGKIIHSLKLPAGAEASVFIQDIDGDSKLELLIADLNGNLTCYKTKSSAKATHGSFR